MTLPKEIYIRELGPREGFQTLAQIVPTLKKLELIEALGKIGVREIELTSFVRPDRVPQMADSEEIVAQYKPESGVKYTALYLNEHGFKRAEDCKRLSNDGWIYLAASETFLKRNNNTTLDEAIASTSRWIELFKLHKKETISVMISTAFGCNYEGKIEQSKVISILDQTISKIEDLGGRIKEVSLADTMGHGTPESVKRLVASAQAKFPKANISLHLHDTRGSGLANVYAGLEMGVTTFDCSIAGLGGCPFAKGAAGNVCTEDVAYMCEEMGVKTGIDLDLAVKAAKLAEKIVGSPLPGKLHKL